MQPAIRFRFFALFLFLATLASGEPRPAMVAWNFDWDNNIAFLNTPIVLFDKKTGAPLEISTAEFAVEETQVGTSGKYASYEISRTEEKNSFKYFSDRPGENNFLLYLEKALAGDHWQGPAWADFVHACSDRQTAQWVTIISARAHERELIMAGLKLLQTKGLIKYLPRIDHIYPVGNPKYKHGGKTDPEAKERTMEDLLTRLSQLEIAKDSPTVLNREGSAPAAMHVWTYSDDDIKNIKTAREALERLLKEKPGRWGNVKIMLSYTGLMTPELKPFKEVLLADGRTRPVKDGEWAAAASLGKAVPCTAYSVFGGGN